jgi:choline dehydrogenase-like flavoprotein
MITAAEYRAWAEESLKWAHEATTESEREAYTKSAEVWLQSALRSERLDSTTKYVWQLPPFQKWRRKGTPTQMALVSRGRKIGRRRYSTTRKAITAAQPMTAEQAATLKRLAQAAYELEAFQPNLTLTEADLRIAMLTAKLKLLGEPPHTL